MKRLKDVYRCVVFGGDMKFVKYNMAERKVYYHCDRCGYEETLTFEEAGIDDEEYAYFILREDGTMTWECPESGVKTENVDENTDFSPYYNIEHLAPNVVKIDYILPK